MGANQQHETKVRNLSVSIGLQGYFFPYINLLKYADVRNANSLSVYLLMVLIVLWLQELSSEGHFQYTSPEVIETRVGELVAKEGVKLYGTKLVGFTPDEAYRRAVKALCEGNASAWKHSTEYRM